MNCKGCQAKGSVACDSCHSGRVTCAGCTGKGHIERWLEVDQSKREDVQIEPDGDVTRAFMWGTDGVTATDESVEADADTVCTAQKLGRLEIDDLPPDVPGPWRTTHWAGIQPRVAPGEKVVHQRFQLLSLPASEIIYVVGNERQVITLEGKRMLAPPAADEVAFARRAAVLRMARLGLLALPLALGLVYLARGSWFLSVDVALVVVCGALAAVLAYASVWQATLLRGRAWAWLGATVVPVAAGFSLAFGAEPSLDRAREALAAGSLDRAEAELTAISPDAGDPEIEETRRKLGLRRVLESSNPTEAATLLARIEAKSAEGAIGLGHVDSLRFAAAMEQANLGKLDDAEKWLALITGPKGTAPETHALATDIQRKRDDLVRKDVESALSVANGEKARAAFKRLSPAAQTDVRGQTLLASIALTNARVAIANEQWLEVEPLAAEIESAGASYDAAKVRVDANRAMDQQVETLIHAANATKDLEARVAAQERAEVGLVRIVAIRGMPEVPELPLLRVRAARDRASLTKQRAAEEKKRATAQARLEAMAKRKAVAQARAANIDTPRASARSSTPTYRSGPNCVKGCPCGNACISCSKRCRH